MGNELRDHATVAGAHARAVGIEDPDDPRIQSVRAVVGHRQGLGEALGLVVRAPRTDRVDVAPVRFGLRVDLGIAVHLTGRGQQVSRLTRLGEPERAQGADAIDLEGMDRIPQVVSGAGGTGEVQDEIDGIVDDERPRHVLPQEPEPTVAAQMGQVSGRPREQAVDPQDAPVPRQKIVAQVRAEESGRPRDQHGRRRSALVGHTRSRCGSARGATSPRPRL